MSKLEFKPMKRRRITRGIVLHHTASGRTSQTGEDLHRMHLAKDWAGVGYHFLVREYAFVDGKKHWEVVDLRPQDREGSHCLAMGRNRDSIGVAVAGNFNNERYTKELHGVLVGLLEKLNKQYKGQLVLGTHQHYGATECPGDHLLSYFDLIVKDSGLIADGERRRSFRKRKQLNL